MTFLLSEKISFSFLNDGLLISIKPSMKFTIDKINARRRLRYPTTEIMYGMNHLG